MKQVIFWDFHGTLAYWPKLFTAGLKIVLDKFEKNHQIKDEDIAIWLKGRFPWDAPDKEYMHLTEPKAWWESIYKVFGAAYVNNGIEPEKISEYLKEARRCIVNPENYSVYDDTIDTLKFFKDNGYRNIILSNHIPELPEIAESIGLMEYIDICISSANIGLEKPNPKIFRYAMETAGNPAEAWMIGDNIKADVRGAEAVGMKAILVRKSTDEPVKYFSPDLKGVINVIHR